jgi:hypothetical protein
LPGGVRAIGEPKLSLAQKLALFDPDRHGGEVMTTGRIGLPSWNCAPRPNAQGHVEP